MKRLGLIKATPMCLPLERGEFRRGVVLIISAIYILIVNMSMTGCSATAREVGLKADVGIIGDIQNKIPLKAALYVPDTTKAYSYTATIPLGSLKFNFGEYITRASYTAFLQVFEEISVVTGKYNLDRFDVVIEPEFVKEKTRVDISISKIDSTVGVDYRVSDRDGVFWQKAFVGNLKTGGNRTDMAEGQALSKAVEQAALQMWVDFNNKTLINKLYVKRISPPKPILKEKVEAFSDTPILKSDVDELPTIKVKHNKNAYAIVIGIENYRQKLPKADFAVSDARLVSEYLTKVMGYQEENVVLLTNEKALQSDLTKYFEKWLHNNVENDGTVFIYYSGHGAPDPKTGGAYLVPYDGDPSFIAETGYSLKRMYDALGKLQAKEIIVALDSCFSGAGGRSVIAKGARPLVMNLQNNMVLSKNMTVLSASSGEQISSTYDEKGHGLFTYFMLKGIKNEDVVKKDGSVAISDLFSYLKPQVERIARRQYNNEQTPQLIGAKKE